MRVWKSWQQMRGRLSYQVTGLHDCKNTDTWHLKGLHGIHDAYNDST